MVYSLERREDALAGALDALRALAAQERAAAGVADTAAPPESATGPGR